MAIGQRLIMAQAMAAALVERGDRAAFGALARRAAAATGVDAVAAGRDGVQFLNTWVPPGEPIDAQSRPDLVEWATEGGRPILPDLQPGPRTGERVPAMLVVTHGSCRAVWRAGIPARSGPPRPGRPAKSGWRCRPGRA